MTCIARFPTKKAFREAVAAGRPIELEDPSIVQPRSVFINWTEGDTMQPGEDCFCTNHPRRSWFAQVVRKADGSYKVL